MKNFYLKAHTGPTIVAAMAAKFREAGLNVTSEGTEAVYFVQQSDAREHAIRDFLNQLHRTHQTVFGYGHRDVEIIREVSEEELAYPNKPAVVTENRIIEVRLTLNPDGESWTVAVTKEFEPRYGGGTQVFTEQAGRIHYALDVARGMVTLSAGSRTDLQEAK